MEVDRKDIKILTNLEVLQLITAKLESKKKIRSQQTLLYTCSKYLKEKCPCSAQTDESVQRFSNAINSFDLNKPEVAMLINHCPSTLVELSVLISDLDSRFSTMESERMLELIAEHFPDAVTISQNINSTGTSNDADGIA